MNRDESFFAALVRDGRPLLNVSALVLIASGGFALFQAATGAFLPHDVAYLGLTADQLCSVSGCRIVHFMMHDRVSFGGVLIAIGTMYLWLTAFPLARGASWAWWAIAISGTAGFLSFLSYLGYGYLDTWHGVATLALLPIFISGLVKTRSLRTEPVPRPRLDVRSRAGAARALLLASTFGLIGAGLVIMTVGMTFVFVPQDLEFMRLTVPDLRAVNSHLVPLIAHDRAGFGGALVSCGLVMFTSVLYGEASRSLWQALAVAGAAGFGTAIGIHPIIGYTSVSHLLPAVAGCLVYAIGLTFAAMPERQSLSKPASVQM